jgi:NADPH:quinone reductase-like Zn-dependent oxidoreductase
MKAITHDRFGGPEVLRLTDLAPPKMHLDSVLVRVKAAAVNPADLGYRAGAMAGAVETYFPVVPGWDVAGVVERAGPGAPEFQPGDEVVGYLRSDVVGRHGTNAELVSANVLMLARKPRNATWAEAAGLPLGGLTAYQAVNALEVTEGEVLLVHGAAGGVGSLAVQLARLRGARVLGTASAGNHEYLRSLGVEPVRYGDGLPERVRALAPDGVDAVLEAAGPGSLGTTPAVGTARVRTATVIGSDYPGTAKVFVRMNRDDLTALVELVEAGSLAVRVGATYPLAEAADAHRALAKGGVPGKIVLEIA